MISNHLVLPILLRRRGFSGEAPEGRAPSALRPRRLRARGAPRRDLRRDPARLRLLPRRRRRGARLDRPPLLRRHRADRAGLLRRPVLGARHGARRERRAPRRLRGLGLHAAPAEPRAARAASGPSFVQQGPFGLDLPEAHRAVRLDAAAAHPRRGLEPRRSTSLAYVGVLAPAPGERARARCRPRPSSAPTTAPIAPTFRLFRASVTVDDLRATVARYLGEERTSRSFESFARSRGQALDGRRRGRHPSPALRRASARLGDRRGLVAARAVAAAAPAQPLDRGRPASCSTTPRRRSSTTATSSSTRSTTPARASPCSTATCGCSPGTGPSSTSTTCRPTWCASASGLDEIVRFNAERGAYGPGPSDELDRAAPPQLRRTIREPERIRLHPSGTRDRDPLEPAARRRLRHDLYRRHRDGGRGGGAGARERDPGAARPRAHRGARPASTTRSRRAKAEADEANLSKTRFLAAASHDILQPLNAARLYATSLVERDRDAGDSGARRERRRLARRGRGDPDRAPRHLAPRRRRDEAGMDELPRRRAVPPAPARVRADRAGARARPRLRAVAR